MTKTEDIYNWPNFVSSMRLLMAPVLVMLAIKQQADWFLLVLIFTVFTDVLDGFLARYLNQITEMGSRLDSWGDFLVYTVMAVSAWLLWPGIVLDQWLYFTIIVISFTLPVLIGIFKFGLLTSYHTWSVKVAVAVTIISYLLLFSGTLEWPFKVAAVVCTYAAIEQIAITLIMRREQVDVRTLWQALALNKRDNAH